MREQLTATGTETAAPAAVVERFARLLESGDLDGACELLSDDVAYTNVSLPTIHGRRRVRGVLKVLLDRPAVGLEVHVHALAADGPVVLTERTDAMTLGPLRVQCWVYGRFEVHEGQIGVWRDSFDWLNALAAVARGLLGVAVPRLRARPPRAADVRPRAR